MEWIKQGLHSWNERRATGPFWTPDLSNLDIAGLFRPQYGNGANQVVYLNRINLVGANLKNSKLNLCVLDGAWFAAADLTGADLSDSRVAGADFGSATLDGSTWFNTKCFRSKMPHGAFSKANLFLRHGTSPEKPIEPTSGFIIEKLADLTGSWSTYESSHDFGDSLNPFISRPERLNFFRGHANSRWVLEPHITRAKSGSNLRDLESTILTELMATRSEEFKGASTLLSQMTLAQHHGLPTRLLDVSSNPLVALYFAVEEGHDELDGRLYWFSVPTNIIKPYSSDTISVICGIAGLSGRDQCMLVGPQEPDQAGLRSGVDQMLDSETANAAYRWEEAMNRLVGQVAREKPYFQDRIEPIDFYRVFVVEPQRGFSRLQSQAGSSLISGFHRRFEPRQIAEATPGVDVYSMLSLVIPATKKREVREELERLNISRETLFPGLADTAEAIKRRYGISGRASSNADEMRQWASQRTLSDLQF